MLPPARRGDCWLAGWLGPVKGAAAAATNCLSHYKAKSSECYRASIMDNLIGSGGVVTLGRIREDRPQRWWRYLLLGMGRALIGDQ